MLPYKIQLALQILNIRGDSNHCILVGNHDDVLPPGSVGTETAWTTAPHLITISLHPVASLLGHASLLCLFFFTQMLLYICTGSQAIKKQPTAITA